MVGRLAASALAAVAVGLLTVGTWAAIRQHNETQIARIAEAESYAARSQLIRAVEQLFTALRMARDYWSEYAHMPTDQWASDAAIELEHFAGVEAVIWDDAGRGVRYAVSQDRPSLRYRPGDGEWVRYQALLLRARAATASEMAGPFVMDNGDVYIEVYMLDAAGGLLAARLNARTTFEHLLRDESPGYTVSVYWGDMALYQRGDATDEGPEAWRREGLIKTSFDTLWRVVHVPGKQLRDTLAPPVIGAILPLGLLIAALVGGLIYENGRVQNRASAAERAERKLADLNVDLERQVELRTRDLEDRTADLQTISDSVTHDLRNPLNTIAVNAELLKLRWGDELGEDGNAIVQATDGAVRRMTLILDRLLGLSAVVHATFDRESVDMERLVRDTFDSLSSGEPPPEAVLHVGQLPAAQADRRLVEMLIMNLLSNALKYTRGKDIRNIRVEHEQHDEGTVYVVADNGIGFEMAAADRLYKAFQRLDDTNGTDGVGLGLTIAARAVTRHGGRIWAESSPGQGARFYFTLASSSVFTPQVL